MRLWKCNTDCRFEENEWDNIHGKTLKLGVAYRAHVKGFKLIHEEIHGVTGMIG